MQKPNVTMVAFYDHHKPKNLAVLLKKVLQKIENLSSQFGKELVKPYSFYQIHATIIGAEANVINGMFYGHWFKKNKQKDIPIDVNKLQQQILKLMQHSPLFKIRFGGFKEAYCSCKDASVREWVCGSSEAEFHSCGRTPYEGTFYAFPEGPTMLSGWPVDNQLEHIRSLYRFRVAVETAGYLDKYHGNLHPYWKDDDCFIRLGTVADNVNAAELKIIEKGVREYLAEMDPITVDIGADDICFLLYKQSALRQKDILGRISLMEFINNPQTLMQLYEMSLVDGDD